MSLHPWTAQSVRGKNFGKLFPILCAQAQKLAKCTRTKMQVSDSLQVSQAQQASSAQQPRQYSLQEIAFPNVKSIGARGSVLMLAVRFEEVVSRGAGAAVALFSGAVIREMYRTKILSVKVRHNCLIHSVCARSARSLLCSCHCVLHTFTLHTQSCSK